ncbi:MAG: hypothetical protein AB2606_07280 [Candidatus Thiodiazotropha taylori]
MLIAMLHLPPLEVYKDLNRSQRESITIILQNNLRTLQDAGFKHIMIENNYDIRKTQYLGSKLKVLIELIHNITDGLIRTDTKYGICTRWCDLMAYKKLLTMELFSFARIPVAGAKVQTRHGDFVNVTYQDIIELKSSISSQTKLAIDLMPKNCNHIEYESSTYTDRIQSLLSNGADYIVIGEKKSAEFYDIGQEINKLQKINFDLSKVVLAGSVVPQIIQAWSGIIENYVVGGWLYQQNISLASVKYPLIIGEKQTVDLLSSMNSV